jgi:hypothetical protein
MAQFPSFLSGLFSGRKRADAPAAAASGSAASDPTLAMLRGKIVMKFDDFMIAVPQGSPTCVVCSRPTYSETRHEGQIVMFEGSENDAPLRRRAGKAFALCEGETCKSCGRQLCWKCIVTVGLGACPKCHQAIAGHPAHGYSGPQLLTEAQQARVLSTLVLARHEGNPHEAPERTARQLAAAGWDDVDAYFGGRYAQTLAEALKDGSVNESKILAALQNPSSSRRIMAIPNKETGEVFNVVVGTAFVEGTSGLKDRVMAECEDGQVRCVMESMMSEVFVALINRAPAAS